MQTFCENMPPIEAIATGTPGDADHTGEYISLKNAPNGVAVVVHVNQANTAAMTLTINQATGVNGGNAKPLETQVPIFANLDCGVGDALARQANSVDFTTNATQTHKIVIFEVRPEDLDVENNFDCISVAVAASHAANQAGALYIPLGRRYPSVSMITD